MKIAYFSCVYKAKYYSNHPWHLSSSSFCYHNVVGLQTKQTNKCLNIKIKLKVTVHEIFFTCSRWTKNQILTVYRVCWVLTNFNSFLSWCLLSWIPTNLKILPEPFLKIPFSLPWSNPKCSCHWRFYDFFPKL